MKNLFNAYVNYCNDCEAKRDAARKANREAHPVFYGIIDAISVIITIISIIMMIYSAIQWAAEKVEHMKQIFNEAMAKSKVKFDGDRDEPVEEDPDEYLEAHADESFMA